MPQWLCEAVAHRFRAPAERTGLRQPNLGRHLHAPAGEGLVRRREGTPEQPA